MGGALETFFESFEFDLSMAVDSSPLHDDVEVKATVPRMNHRDFAYDINVHNEKSTDAHSVVRIYLCPSKNNQGVKFTYDEGRWHCIEMDKFWTHLTPGDNHLVRKSSESSVTIPDIPSFSTLIHDAAPQGQCRGYGVLAQRDRHRRHRRRRRQPRGRRLSHPVWRTRCCLPRPQAHGLPLRYTHRR